MVIGKTNEEYVKLGLDKYCKLLSKYCNFEIEVLNDVKNGGKLPEEKLKQEEAKIFKARINPKDKVILLDENGKEFNSEDFAEYYLKKVNEQKGRIVFIIGGAFGFSEEIRVGNDRISLSALTFNHQMVRLIFCEQLFRAYTILNNTPYHH
ncbi:MAG: 23S rRNA (pseudouridine(1915)-N(3))-methyltransferase RlmH [Bacteroidia bacterium]|nr:23S rRNA (pseudouridine(1915)-N(3))-methyltransferase RlmH [Bacteroidia bacterium]